MCIVKVLDRLEMTSFARNLLLYGCIDVLCGISACQKVSSLTQISSSTNMIDKQRRPYHHSRLRRTKAEGTIERGFARIDRSDPSDFSLSRLRTNSQSTKTSGNVARIRDRATSRTGRNGGAPSRDCHWLNFEFGYRTRYVVIAASSWLDRAAASPPTPSI